MDSISEDKLLLARAQDAIHLCDKNGFAHCIGFLDERQRSVLTAAVHHCSLAQCVFWGGYAEAERTYFAAFPTFLPLDYEQVPVTALQFSYRDMAQLTHRDFLGTLLSLGVRREAVGDIICNVGHTVVFVADTVATFLSEQIDKVGGESVTVTVGIPENFSVTKKYAVLECFIASVRMDNIAKALIGCSREQAAQMVRSGLVSLNHVVCENVSAAVAEGDTLSIRGVGRFRVHSVEGRTKKGRVILIAHKYI